jgi:clan AA aspartic protease (TIGR02281 family)
MKKIVFSIFLFLFIISISNAQVRIKMKLENGVYTTPCTVNGLRLRFVFDTGASNVSISLSEAIFMVKNGYLDESDLHGSSYSQIANGDVVKNTTISIKEMEIGGRKLYNVKAVIVHKLLAPLLLGQSAIQKLGKIQIEGDELVIMDTDSPSNKNACIYADSLIKQATGYYESELYSLCTNTFQKAYDLCPGAVNFPTMYMIGDAYYRVNNYQQAIRWMEKALNGEYDKEVLSVIYRRLGTSYMYTNDYDNSILNYEKSLSFTTKNNNKAITYAGLGELYFTDIIDYQQAFKYFELSSTFQLLHLSSTYDDVIQGKVKDSILGEVYYYMSGCCEKLKQREKADTYAIYSAQCGNDIAKQFCKNYGLKY